MSEHNYQFGVKMTCGGCSTAVNRILANWANETPGVKSYNVSLEEKLVEVTTDDSVDYKTVLERVKKSGKEVTKGNADGQPMSITV